MQIGEEPSGRLLFRMEEAASALAISRSTMYALAAKGAIDTVVIGRSRRVPAEALHRYLEQLQIGGPHF